MKKENYFTSGQVHNKTRSVLNSILSANKKPAQVFQPLLSALLVLDMQAYFLEPSSHAFIPSGPEIIAPIQRLINKYEEHEFPIIFTRHINNASNAGMMATWWQELITHDHPLSDIVPELDVDNGVVIEKGQYDAFLGTELKGLLLERGIQQLVITGVMTHLCCETTARSGFMQGFEVFFVIDATATYNLAFHKASLINLGHGFADLVLTDETIDVINKHHEE